MGLLSSKKINQKCALCGGTISEKTETDNLCTECYRQTVNVSAILKYLQNTSIENLNAIQNASFQVSRQITSQMPKTGNYEFIESSETNFKDISVTAEKYYVIRNKTGEKFLLSENVSKIGKNGEMANIVISDNNTLSRCHAKLEKTPDGICLSDCNSKNGTRYNGMRLELGQKVIVNPGDNFFLANEVLTLIKE